MRETDDGIRHAKHVILVKSWNEMSVLQNGVLIKLLKLFLFNFRKINISAF